MKSIGNGNTFLLSCIALLKVITAANLLHNVASNSPNSGIAVNVFKEFSEIQMTQPTTVASNTKFQTKLARFARGDSYGEDIEFITDADLTFHNAKEQIHVTEPVHRKDLLNFDPTNTDTELKANEENTTAKNSVEIQKYENVEYEERSSGAILGKLNAVETSNALPIFLTEPENVYVVKTRPAVLKCKAVHALQLFFKCSGSSQPPPSTTDKHVDPHTGVHVEEVTAVINRDLVDEYFGKGPFKCECHAWSSRGITKSQSATINIAYLRRHFVKSPTSLKVESGSKAELHCEPPGGFPEPKITWYKNNVPISGTNDHGVTVSADGTLTFSHVSLQDMANYTCSAENIAGKRTSDSAVLIVYVNGAWSAWSPWRECKCYGKQSQGRKRVRTCTNPIPMNGGSLCSGPQVQKSPDCITCPEDTQIINSEGFDIPSTKRIGRWSVWSDWSSCSTECIQVRHRKCVPIDIDDDEMILSDEDDTSLMGNADRSIRTNAVANVGYGRVQCIGKDIQTAECRGENCHISKDGLDWTLYLGLAFITTVCFAFGAALIYCARRNLMTSAHYSMSRTAVDSEYAQDINKKGMDMHIEAVNVNYDYPSAALRFIPNEHMINSGVSEHHYDVPNLSANYTNPIDELSVEYVTDTPDSSTADTSNSTYDITTNLSTTPALPKNVITDVLNSSGGSLSLYNGEIKLHVPEHAIGKNHKKQMSLILLNDDIARISVPCADPLLVCSTIVHCAPRNYSFLKPVILKVPHCLVNPRLWNVNIYHADNDHNDVNTKWRKIVSVGKETINTPVFVHLEESQLYIMTEQLGRFAVVADFNATTLENASIRMRLIAFSQLTPSNLNCSLRIYIVKDFPNSKDICTAIEKKLGGSLMGESKSFAFHLNNSDLTIRVQNSESSLWEVQEQTEYEHVIPYNHILSNNSIMHCEFSIKHPNTPLSLEVLFEQCKSDETESELYSFDISEQYSTRIDAQASCDQQMSIISMDCQGNYVNETNVLELAHLPRTTKRMICTALDPPRLDERDWRLLAKKLNTDHYIAYFATKPSPTEQILNLWECRASGSSHTIVDLLNIFKDMGREDIREIITETIGPLWV